MNKDNIIIFSKACISSITSAAIDLGIFTLISRGSSKFIIISVATVVARVISTICNFTINKLWTFKSDGSVTEEGILFFILFIVKMLLSSILVWLFNKYIIINQTVLKSIVDILLFFASYMVQKKLIFKK